MEFKNLSGKNFEYNLDKNGLNRVVIMPDYAPGKYLPVGTALFYEKDGHKIKKEYLGTDVGCGMVLSKFEKNDFNLEQSVNEVTEKLIENNSGLGSLGGGNHFITIYELKSSDNSYFREGDFFSLIHSGSRERGRIFYQKNLDEKKYFDEQGKIIKYAVDNRLKLLDLLNQKTKTKSEVYIHNTHNFIERTSDEIIYRKGLIKLNSGELSVIPSSMSGEAVIIRAKNNVKEIGFSLPHATGRKISRSEAKTKNFFSEGFPKNIHFPYFLYAENLNEELPENYNDLEGILKKIEDYITIEATLTPKASIML